MEREGAGRLIETTQAETAQMGMIAFCGEWLPRVRLEPVKASAAPMPSRATRYRRRKSEPLPYGSRLSISQPSVPLGGLSVPPEEGGEGGRVYEWLFRRARVNDLRVRHLWQRAVHFRFHAVYGDQEGEELFSLIADPVNGRALRIPQDGLEARRRMDGTWPRWSDWRLPGAGRPADRRGGGDGRGAARRAAPFSVRTADYALHRAYQLARRAVDGELKRRGRQREMARHARMEREQVRLDAYYEELRAEVVGPLRRLYHQIAVGRVRKQLTHSPQTAVALERELAERVEEARKVEARCEEEIDWLGHEWRLRSEELAARTRLRARVALLSAAWAWMPRLACEVELDGEAARSLTLLWDVSTAWPLRDGCEGCGRSTTSYTLCKGGHLLCPACASICPECGRGLCEGCTTRCCTACEALLCPDCGTPFKPTLSVLGRRAPTGVASVERPMNRAVGRSPHLCSRCRSSAGIGLLDEWIMGTVRPL